MTHLGRDPACRAPWSTPASSPTPSCSSASRTSTSSAGCASAGFAVLVDVPCARRVAHRQTAGGARRGAARPPARRRRRAVARLLPGPQLLRPGPAPRPAELVGLAPRCSPCGACSWRRSGAERRGHRGRASPTACGAGWASTPATCATSVSGQSWGPPSRAPSARPRPWRRARPDADRRRHRHGGDAECGRSGPLDGRPRAHPQRPRRPWPGASTPSPPRPRRPTAVVVVDNASEPPVVASVAQHAGPPTGEPLPLAGHGALGRQPRARPEGGRSPSRSCWRRAFDYAWVLDDDIVADPDCLEALLGEARHDPKAAFCFPAPSSPTARWGSGGRGAGS